MKRQQILLTFLLLGITFIGYSQSATHSPNLVINAIRFGDYDFIKFVSLR